MTITTALARHTAEASRIWPAEVQQSALRAVIDTCACVIAGRNDAAARTISATLSRWQSGTAVDLVSLEHTAAPWAAMVNATAAHALDYDDVLETAAAHASAVFVPALLALAQERKASGAQVLDALAISFDVMNALAAAVNYPHYSRGWHTTLTLGAPAAAAGCARLLGLDTAGAARAISTATSFSSGSKLQFGTQMKPTHAGIAAQAGILAASFAEQGLTAAPEIFEGPWSFETLFGAEGMPGFRVAEERLKGPPALAEPGAWIKAYPCCASAHRPIDAMLHLRQSSGTAARDIERVDTYVSTVVQKNLMYEVPRDEMEGRFSLNHCLAAAACRGSADLADFTLEALADPELIAFWSKVFMHLDPEIPANLAPASGEERCRLRLTLTGGRTLEHTVVFPSGHPQAPMSDADLERKFKDCATGVLAPAATDAALDGLLSLPHANDVDAALKALVPS
ncbi:MAG: MmgE/PrpD family protein [Hyphomicrobium sp.]|nr:MmgE/PrpD family protein [Hyphomicrobium sp.]